MDYVRGLFPVRVQPAQTATDLADRYVLGVRTQSEAQRLAQEVLRAQIAMAQIEPTLVDREEMIQSLTASGVRIEPAPTRIVPGASAVHVPQNRHEARLLAYLRMLSFPAGTTFIIEYAPMDDALHVACVNHENVLAKGVVSLFRWRVDGDYPEIVWQFGDPGPVRSLDEELQPAATRRGRILDID